MPLKICNISAAASTVKLNSWNTPRRSSLPQPRIEAPRIGSGPDSPASPPRMPPAKQIAVEVQEHREHQQEHADRELEDFRIGLGHQPGAERHAGEATDHEGPDQ